MSNVELLKVKKDFIWNIGMFSVAIGLLVVGSLFGIRMIHDGQPTKDSLQILATVTAIPTFFLVAAFNRISAETVGVLLGAIIGFGLGKLV